MFAQRCAGLWAALLALIIASPVAAQWTVTGQAVPQLAAFDTMMQNLMTSRNIPSGQIAVGWQGRLVLARGYSWNRGPDDLLVQPDSLFRIASISKPITATLVNRLIQDGQLSPNATIGSFIDLTPRPGTTADPRLATVTVRNLLEMLGGFPDPSTAGYDPVFRDRTVAQALGIGLPVTHADVIRYQNGVALSANPGATYAYSNYGYKLLGRIIEVAAGMPYARYAERVFNPVGIWDMRLARALPQLRARNEVAYHSGLSLVTVMDNSGATVPLEYGGLNNDTMDSYGGWIASAPELMRWLTNLDNPAAPGAILDATSLARMFGLPQNHPLPYQPGDYYYASGWQVRDYGAQGRTTWHSGSLPSTSAYVVRYRNGFSIAVLLNRRNESNGNETINAIDSGMWTAYGQVTTWPAHDLFAQTLQVIMRAGFD